MTDDPRVEILARSAATTFLSAAVRDAELQWARDMLARLDEVIDNDPKHRDGSYWRGWSDRELAMKAGL